MLGAGLAAVGEGADVGVAALSAEALPVCGDGREEEEPAEAPPMLFCRGERGLWAVGRKKNVMCGNQHTRRTERNKSKTLKCPTSADHRGPRPSRGAALGWWSYWDISSGSVRN